MQKKIFCPKIYPLDRNTNCRWFIRFFTKNCGVSVKHVVIIPKKLAPEARLRWAADYIAKVEKVGYEKVEPVERSFNKHIKLLFEHLDTKTKIGSKSRSSYLGHVRGLNDYCEKNNVSSITEGVAYDFLKDLETGHSERTVNHYRRTLIEFYEELVRKCQVKKNPFRHTKRLKTKKAFSEHYTDKEIALITEGVKKYKPFLYLPMMTILHCATRNGREMPNIKVEDIDFEGGKLWLNATFSKNGEKEAVRIPDNLLRIFEAHQIQDYPPQYYLFGKKGVPSVGRVGQNYLQDHFKVVLELVGIYKKGKGFYRLKNCLAVKMVKKNVSKFAIQKQFRHKRFDTTEKYLTSLQIEDFPELKDFSFF